MKYLLGKFARHNWMVFVESSERKSWVSIPMNYAACILNWYSKKNDDYMLVIHYSSCDMLRHLFLNRAAKALPIRQFRKSSCKFLAALSSLSTICRVPLSCLVTDISHTFFQFPSEFWTLRWEDFVTFVCEWVVSLRLFLTVKDQDSWNAHCSFLK